MKRALSIFATLLCLGLAIGDADAASRLGGGRSSGMQRNNVMQKQATPPATPPSQTAAKPATPATPPAAAPVTPQPAPSGMSRWLGPLAGLAVGAGLASMFMGGMGAGGGMGGVLMILLLAAAAYFLFATLRRRSAGAAPLQFAGQDNSANQYSEPRAASPMTYDANPPAMQTAEVLPLAGNVNVPAGFDKDGFLRQAKVNFMRLQAANDRKDLHDISNFTTPEMYAEIALEAQERGSDAQQIDVTELHAELLDVTEGAEQHLASVRFFGTLRDAPNGPIETFDEVWHLAKEARGQSGWLIAGIQQAA